MSSFFPVEKPALEQLQCLLLSSVLVLGHPIALSSWSPPDLIAFFPCRLLLELCFQGNPICTQVILDVVHALVFNSPVNPTQDLEASRAEIPIVARQKQPFLCPDDRILQLPRFSVSDSFQSLLSKSQAKLPFALLLFFFCAPKSE